MQLSRLYSNQNELFEVIDFNCCDRSDVVNVIYGAVTDKSDTSKDSHNLGKTTLIHLIDFMFLKDITSGRHFLSNHAERFHNFVFYLEIALNNGGFITVRRGVENNKSIAMVRHEDRGQDFQKQPDENWDHPDVTLTAARELLDGILDLKILSPYVYRKALTYFLRTQDDYLDVLQLKKFSTGKHQYWKPFVMTLLGFNEVAVKNKYVLDGKISTKESEKNKKQAELQVDEDDPLRLAAEIQNLRVQLEDTEKQLDRFEFTDEERRLMHELVDEIEGRISEINNRLYNIKIDIRNIDEALANKVAFKLRDIKEIFEESEIHFPDQLKKSYEDLVTFNRTLTNERNYALRSRRKQLVEEKDSLAGELGLEDSRRQEYRKILHGSDTLDKFKALQRNLADQQAHLIYLEGQYERLTAISDLESKINKLIRDRSQTVDEIKALISRGTPIREKVATDFNLFCKRVLDHDGLFFVRQNTTGNVDFPVELKEKGTSKASSQAQGKSYKQIICALFDLALLKTYEDAPFYHFVYHDGILEGLDNRKKILFLEVVQEVISSGKIQYILSVIDSDIPRNSKGERVEFSDEEVVLHLSDCGEEGRLFKMAEF